MSRPKWNVICYDNGRSKIEVYNIFEHDGFWKYVKEASRKCKTKREFAEQLHGELHYYFRGKCEWEIMISPWIGGEDFEGEKVDVCWQVLNNWDIFVDYTWNALKNKQPSFTEAEE